jgi:hypothetical protein
VGDKKNKNVMDKKQYDELGKDLVSYGYKVTKHCEESEYVKEVCRTIRKEYRKHAINYLVYIYGENSICKQSYRVEISIEVLSDDCTQFAELNLPYLGQTIDEIETLAYEFNGLVKPYLVKK